MTYGKITAAGRFFDKLMAARQITVQELCAILRTSPTILNAVRRGTLSDLPSVWKDRLQEAFALTEEDCLVMQAAFRAYKISFSAHSI